MGLKSKIWCLLVALLVAQCADVGRDQRAVLTITLPEFPKQRTAASFSAAPSTIAAFDCFVVNVMGTGISAIGSAPNQATMDQIIAGSKCTYPGKMSRLLTAGAPSTVQFDLAKGTSRVVQILGVVSPGGCGVSQDLKDYFSGPPTTVANAVFPGVYEVGRQIVDITADTSVSITGSYSSSTARDARCGYINVDCSLAANQSTTPVGSGSSGAPFRLCTAAQLPHINAHISSYYTLENNIDLQGANLSPLTAGSAYLSTFDGQGYTISNLAQSGTNPNGGLFAVLSSGAIVKRLNLANFSVTGTGTLTGAGLLVGSVTGSTITEVKVSGSVSGAHTAGMGGLAGQVSDSTVSYCTSSATVTQTAANPYNGGLIGRFASTTSNSSLTHSSASGLVTATTPSSGPNGGLVGQIAASSTGTVTISQNYATGDVNSAGVAGGFVGVASSGAAAVTITDNYSTGTVAAGTSYAGGFFGGLSGSAVSLARNYTNTTSVTGGTPGCFGGMVASSSVASNDYCPSALALGGVTVMQLSPAQFLNSSNFSGWDFNTVWTINAGVSAPTLRP